MFTTKIMILLQHKYMYCVQNCLLVGISNIGRLALLHNCAVENQMHFTSTFKNEQTCFTNEMLKIQVIGLHILILKPQEKYKI